MAKILSTASVASASVILLLNITTVVLRVSVFKITFISSFVDTTVVFEIHDDVASASVVANPATPPSFDIIICANASLAELAIKESSSIV